MNQQHQSSYTIYVTHWKLRDVASACSISIHIPFHTVVPLTSSLKWNTGSWEIEQTFRFIHSLNIYVSRCNLICLVLRINASQVKESKKSHHNDAKPVNTHWRTQQPALLTCVVTILNVLLRNFSKYQMSSICKTSPWFDDQCPIGSSDSLLMLIIHTGKVLCHGTSTDCREKLY